MPVDATAKNPAQAPVPPGTRVAFPQAFRVELHTMPPWVRPEVTYWYGQWLTIRDATAGERAIKMATTSYLPQLEGMDAGEYTCFLDRATYYNFTGRTVSALSGSIFRRQPVLEGLPQEQKDRLEHISKDNTDFDTFASGVGEEVIKLGRNGILVELPANSTTDPRPYLCTYVAENILDWDVGLDDSGRTMLNRVVLREAWEGKKPGTQERQVFARYRELVLENDVTGKRVYRQYLYQRADGDADLKPDYRSLPITPLRRGETLDFIPFRIIGPHTSSIEVEKPPMEDIALLNLSHYRSYAYLEHGRFFTGFPIYTVERAGGAGEMEYQIGSMKVWELAAGSKAHVLEMAGQGLIFLENACEQKEAQAATLGGRMMDVRAIATSESNNALKLKERNEQSVLLKIARQLDRGLTQVLRWWAWWQGLDEKAVAKIFVTFNKDFLFDGIGAREFRAIHAMYKDGVLPIDVVYHYLKKADVIPDWMTIEEFKQLLEKMEQFPMQPDAEARKDGFKDRQQQLTSEQKIEEQRLAEEELKLAKKVAAKPTPAPVVPPGGPARPPVKVSA